MLGLVFFTICFIIAVAALYRRLSNKVKESFDVMTLSPAIETIVWFSSMGFIITGLSCIDLVLKLIILII